MHGFQMISTVNMMYTRSKNYTNMLIDEHGVQTFEVVVGVLLVLLSLIDVFVPTKCTSLIILRQVVCLNILKYHMAMSYNRDSSENNFLGELWTR